MREKDKPFRENYERSFLYSAKFASKTLQDFRNNVKKLNSNVKVKKPKTKEQLKQEKFKHDQNKRASERRGLPMLDLETANRFLDGKYHEQSEEEEDYENIGGDEKENKRDDFEAMQQEF